jgi:hypothetical protein
MEAQMNITRSLRARHRITQVLARAGQVGVSAAVLAAGLLLAPAFATPAFAADYGPDTCLNGFVWREAYPGDHVCVTPATRSQAAANNAQAAAHRNAPGLRLSTYTLGARCVGDVCSSTSTDSIPRYRLYGDHVNTGPVLVELRRINGDVLVKRWQTTARPAAAVGGQFTLDTGVFVCGGAKDSYFRLRDQSSGRLSPAYQVSTRCKVL